jgi:hypothetical protein
MNEKEPLAKGMKNGAKARTDVTVDSGSRHARDLAAFFIHSPPWLLLSSRIDVHLKRLGEKMPLDDRGILFLFSQSKGANELLVAIEVFVFEVV